MVHESVSQEATERVSATAVIEGPVHKVFAVLADPAQHAAIDGTGWVCEPLDNQVLTAVGQIFRMGMHHDGHPDGDYLMYNRVQVFDPPNAVSWEPGYDAGDGRLGFGGWIWRYNLASAGPGRTQVTLSYDWSAVADAVRQNIQFPPFGPDHLANSLAHLAELVAA